MVSPLSLTQGYNCDFRLDREHDVLLFLVELMDIRLGANLALDVVERIVCLRGLTHYGVDDDPLEAEDGYRHSDQNIEKFFSSRHQVRGVGNVDVP